MKKLTLGTLLALVLVLAAGAFAVQAAPPMGTPTPEPIKPSFTDGRINAYDPGAPVAIFETRQNVPIVNDNGVPTTADVVNGVQLLFWDGASAKEVLNVSANTIDAAISKFTGAKATTMTTSPATNTTSNSSNTTANTSTSSNSNTTANTTGAASSTKLTTVNNGNSIVISQKNGYTLYYSKDGYLWITTPANYEGKTYTFSWQKDF